MKLKKLISGFEGNRSRIYDDATGKDIDWNKARELGLIEGYATVGIGRNVEAKPFSDREIDVMYEADISIAKQDLFTVFGDQIDTFSENRHNALVSVMMNLGLTKFRKFENMIAAIKLEDWEEAAKELLDSERGRQIENRSTEEAFMLRAG